MKSNNLDSSILKSLFNIISTILLSCLVALLNSYGFADEDRLRHSGREFAVERTEHFGDRQDRQDSREGSVSVERVDIQERFQPMERFQSIEPEPPSGPPEPAPGPEGSLVGGNSQETTQGESQGEGSSTDLPDYATIPHDVLTETTGPLVGESTQSDKPVEAAIPLPDIRDIGSPNPGTYKPPPDAASDNTDDSSGTTASDNSSSSSEGSSQEEEEDPPPSDKYWCGPGESPDNSTSRRQPRSGG